MKSSLVLGSTLLAWGIAGCALDASSNGHGRPCTGDDDCSAADVCYRGFCVARDGAAHDMDGGLETGPRDGGPDAQIDGSPDVDGGACDGGGETCSTGQPGVCATGALSCSGTCVRTTDPSAESCNGRDDDCDGRMDEEASTLCYPPGTSGCTPRADGTFDCVGACRPGVAPCAGGAPGACAGARPPAATDPCQSPTEIGIDENCNGTIDEGCGCTEGTSRACFTGAAAMAGVGECRVGTQACTGGHWGSCTGAGAPMPETCMNQSHDDDCDGTPDNIAGRGAPCTIPGRLGACANGTMDCDGGALACSGPSPAADEACDMQDDDCDGAVDESFVFASDTHHCGMCGNDCGSGLCCNGHCVDPTDDERNCGGCMMPCDAGSECCASSCFDVQTDENNCGGCGVVCGSTQTCCGGRCVDTTSDAANCGACGAPCATGAATACCHGTCLVPTDPTCTGCAVDCSTLSPTQTCCGDRSCHDTQTDESHCGTCGHACGAGQFCCGGACVDSDATHCGGSCASCAGGLCCDDVCVSVDPSHCQSCDVSCALGSTCCAAGCFDLAHDPDHCGTCTQVCPAGSRTCSAGHCCGAGTTWCGSSCIDVMGGDNANCGGCGVRCTGLNHCSGGRCVLLG